MKSSQLRGVFSSSATLSRLYSQAAYQNGILKILYKTLPFPKQAISACYLESNVLTIYCPDGTWLTRLQFRKKQILQLLHDETGIGKIDKVIIKLKHLA